MGTTVTSMLTLATPVLLTGRVWLPCRVFSIVGVVGTTFTSMLMLATSATHGPLPGVTRTGPPSFEKFWVGATNILFVFGGHAMCVEVSWRFDLGLGLWGGVGPEGEPVMPCVLRSAGASISACEQELVWRERR